MEETPDTSNKRARSQNDQPGGFTYVDKDGEPGRRKIRIEYISDKSRRHITFSKRKAGIMKKVSHSCDCLSL
jgi:MADS-box transcription factor